MLKGETHMNKKTPADEVPTEHRQGGASGVLAMSWLIGIFAILLGIFQLLLGLKIQRLARGSK